MQRFFSVLAILWLYLNPVSAQVLDVGDTIPATPFSFVQPGRVTILDFMATTCSGCVEALGRMDTLQQQFGGRLHVIPVTFEDSARVNSFLAHNHIGKRIRLPFIIGDTVLTGYFPHAEISHVIWIGADRVVKAITYSQYVKYDNLLDILSNKPVHWPVKRDGFMEGVDTIKLFSAFMHFQPAQNVTASLTIDSAKGLVFVRFSNLRVLDLAKQVFGCLDLPASHVLFRVKDLSRYVYDKSKDYQDQFDLANRYCYTAVLPLSNWREKVLADLGFFLHVKASYKLQMTRVDLLAADANTLYDLNNRYTGRPVLYDKAGKGVAVKKIPMLTIQDF